MLEIVIVCHDGGVNVSCSSDLDSAWDSSQS